jgi:hypothetical protein
MECRAADSSEITSISLGTRARPVTTRRSAER